MNRIKTRPLCVGLAAFCAKWFEDVGLQGDSEFDENLRGDYRRMEEYLNRYIDTVVAPGVISTVEAATKVVACFHERRIDALIVVHIFWSEDQPLIALLKNRCEDWPVVLWNYHPLGYLPSLLTVNDLFRCSGTVGMLQGSAPMQRLGIDMHIISGSPGDEELGEELTRLSSALYIRKTIHSLSIGRIAGRCEVMTGTHTDATTLRSRLGITLLEISSSDYASRCAAVSVSRVAAWCDELKQYHPACRLTDANLELACRIALAADDIAIEYDLSGVAIQDLDPELHELIGGRPCLCPPECASRGVALVMESDVNTGIGMYATMRAADSPALYTEIFTYDEKENCLLMGHAAPHDPRLAGSDGVSLVPDAEYRHVDVHEGVWQEFIMREGEVTCVSLYDNGQRYSLTAFEGYSVGAPRRLDGFAHAVVRPNLSVRELLPRLVRRGMTQHFAIVPGRVASTLETWCAMTGIEYHLETSS